MGYGLGDEEEGPNVGGMICAHVESTYVVSLRDMDMKHIKDFVFLHGKHPSPSFFRPSAFAKGAVIQFTQ